MVKYVVIDLSKLDGDKLGEMLTEAYQQGYNDARGSNTTIGYETSPWVTVSGISVGDSMTNAIETIPYTLTTASTSINNSVTEAIDSAIASKAKKNTHKVANSPD